MAIAPGLVVRAPELVQHGSVVAYGTRDTSSATFTTTETVVQSVSFDAVAGVQYEVSAVQAISSTTAGGTTIMRLRWQSGGTLTTSGTQFGSIGPPIPSANLSFTQPLNFLFTSSFTGQISVGVTAVRDTNTGTIQSFGSVNQVNSITVRAA